jgi:hypothetical protein
MNGVMEGHAYTVISCHEVVDKEGQDIQLIKMRNPWGENEWLGDWSDKSPKWSEATK